MTFVQPAALLLLLLLPPWFILARRRRRRMALDFPAAGPLAALRPTLALRLHALLPWLRLAAIACLILAVARPQWGVELSQVQREGVTIAMVIDISSSMRAIDLEQGGRPTNRLEAVKATFREFVAGGPGRAVDGADGAASGRDGDAIAMVTFARYADAVIPPTLDHGALLGLLDQVEIVDLPIEDGTAIGDALLRTIELLRRAGTGGDRVIILLTDGSNNVGAADPLVAARIAAALRIKVYTIGAGSRGKALIPVPAADGGVDHLQAEVEIDEDTLRLIAEATGGRYFRATDSAALRAIYGEIDQLETARDLVEQYQIRIDLFPCCLALGLMLLLAELGLGATRLQAVS